MPRFFLESRIADEATQIMIQGSDARHIRDVLRMQPGDSLIICDGARVDLACTIQSFSDSQVELAIESRTRNETEPSFEATLFQGLPKGDKFDQIIQKCVELGIGRIVPVSCTRSIAKVCASDVPKKVLRWNRIALEAAKQCGRGRIPEVAQPMRFADAIAEVASAWSPHTIAFIPYEDERMVTLRQHLESVPSKSGQRIAFFIGPEGGFSPEEIAAASAAGIQPVSLGRRILRTETAGLAVLAMIGYHLDDF